MHQTRKKGSTRGKAHEGIEPSHFSCIDFQEGHGNILFQMKFIQYVPFFFFLNAIYVVFTGCNLHCSCHWSPKRTARAMAAGEGPSWCQWYMNRRSGAATGLEAHPGWNPLRGTFEWEPAELFPAPSTLRWRLACSRMCPMPISQMLGWNALPRRPRCSLRPRTHIGMSVYHLCTRRHRSSRTRVRTCRSEKAKFRIAIRIKRCIHEWEILDGSEHLQCNSHLGGRATQSTSSWIWIFLVWNYHEEYAHINKTLMQTVEENSLIDNSNAP